jgi:Phosphoesterase family
MKPIGSSVPLVHWFKVDVSNPNAPALVAQGDISGASIGTNVATFNSSIAVDAAGDVLINFTASGPNNYPSDYYVFQGAGDPTGSFSAPILYQASTGFFDSGDGASVQRWGLNSSTTVDPNNPNSFWLSNEYVANGWWQTSVAQVAIQNIGAPTVASIATSGTGIANGTGDLNAGKVITLTVNFSAAVTVNTTGGSPTLTLNDGGTATYVSGSGTTALTFNYTVAAAQNTSDLVVSSFNLNGAIVKDGAGNAANLAGAISYNPAGTLQIDTAAPTVASIVPTGTGIINGSGNPSTGQVVTLTVNFSEPVTVNTTGGTPTLALNDGGTATFTGGSGSTALTFSYTIAAGQTTPDLTISAFNLNGAVVIDGAGNAATLTGATNYNPAGTLQINVTAPTFASIVPTGTGITSGSGDLNAGKVITLTANFSAAVTVNTTGGTPTLTLNDGGTATYVSGSGTTALTFSYTVAAAQNTADLVISSFNLNGATVKDGAGNAANLSGATNYNPAGTLQIDTTAPTVASVVPTGTGITNGTGNLGAGQAVTLTANFSEAVTVNTTGGSPTITLNDGGTATYTGGSGTSALTFTYTAAAGQNTPDLSISAFNLNGATVIDGAGNAANLAGAANYNPSGSLKVNTTGVPNYSHIVVVVEENKNNDEITGNTAQAPFINSLMTSGASLTNFTAETHPSQPNYYALYAGSTFGIADDADGHNLPDPTLYTVLQNAGLTFKGYVDDSGTGNSSNHEPWTSFPESRTVQTDFITFPSLFASGNYSSLPAVSFVIPNPQNDMHDGTVAQGDTWLQQNLGAYAQWALANNSLLVVTWDENDNEAVNQIPTLLYGANVVPGNYSAAYNHYNVLSTVLAPFGLTGPNNAATAAPIQVFGGGSAAVSSITTSGSGITSGTGDLNVGKTVTITVNFSAAVTVNTSGGSPTLTLNDGGAAAYTAGSGTTALSFSYTVAAGQNTPDLVVSALNLNGATIKDGAGNNANLTGANNFNPTGTLQIDTVVPTVASIVASGPAKW